MTGKNNAEAKTGQGSSKSHRFSKIEPGTQVRIYTKDETYKGTLMPRPPLLKGKLYVLKLENGYNIGIEETKIEDIEKITSSPKKDVKKSKLEKKNLENEKDFLKRKNKGDLPKVTILSCGGTISSKIDYRTGGVYADYSAEDFLVMLPELADIAQIKAKKIMSVMSEDMTSEEWIKMAKAVKKELEDSDAVILTQGTDTLHYSTAALSFFLEDVDKPVIFTAAQRSIDRGSSDAFLNLICSVKTAVNFDGAGVFLVMHGSTSDDFCYVHKGTKVRKMHSLRRDAFRSINDIALAKVYGDKDDMEIMNEDYVKKDSSEKLKLKASFEDKTALLYFYPGMKPDIIDYYIDKGYRGIVIAATALGHVSTDGKNNLLKQLQKAKKKGVVMVVATQCLYGRVDPLVYTPLRKLSVENDVVFAEDMLPEVAYVKLGWLLSRKRKPEDVKSLMKTNLRGEIKLSQDPRAFLN